MAFFFSGPSTWRKRMTFWRRSIGEREGGAKDETVEEERKRQLEKADSQSVFFQFQQPRALLDPCSPSSHASFLTFETSQGRHRAPSSCRQDQGGGEGQEGRELFGGKSRRRRSDDEGDSFGEDARPLFFLLFLTASSDSRRRRRRRQPPPGSSPVPALPPRAQPSASPARHPLPARARRRALRGPRAAPPAAAAAVDALPRGLQKGRRREERGERGPLLSAKAAAALGALGTAQIHSCQQAVTDGVAF